MPVCGFPSSIITAAIAVAVTMMMLILILAPGMRGYGGANVFAYHPVFMSLAFCLFMPIGLISYVFDFGPKGNAAYPDRGSRRLLHGGANMIAAFFAIAGYLVAFVYHQQQGIDHLALNEEEKTRTAHVFFGMFALAGVVLQSVVGLWKMVTLAREGRKVVPQHGRVGPAVWVCGLVCICLAAWFEYRENFTENKVRWLLGQVFAIWVGVAALLAAVLFHLFRGSRAHVAPAADGKLGSGLGGGPGGGIYDSMDDEPHYAHEVRGVRKQLIQ